MMRDVAVELASQAAQTVLTTLHGGVIGESSSQGSVIVNVALCTSRCLVEASTKTKATSLNPHSHGPLQAGRVRPSSTNGN